jgi:Holliday junction resolvasome RuvABC endonuclease subunit
VNIVKRLRKIKKTSSAPEVKQIGLFLDPSGSHLSFTYAELNSTTNKMTILEAGLVWTKGTWNRGQRFDYMYKCLDLLINTHRIVPNFIVTESFFMNPKLRTGTVVIPIINGLIEMIVSRDARTSYLEVPPPVWRATLGVKPIKDSKGKRNYKLPTKAIIEGLIGKLPEEIKSNITLKPRATPSDLADSLAIALAHGKRNGMTSFEVERCTFNPFTITDSLNKIANSLE